MESVNMPLKGKRILITSGDILLSELLTKKLQKEGASVSHIKLYTLDSDIQTINLIDKKTLQTGIKSLNPQIVFHITDFHLTDVSYETHDTLMRLNYHSTINLLGALEKSSFKNLIYLSSSDVYGRNKAPYSEDMLPNPVSSYGLSKFYAEEAIISFCEAQKKSYSIMRAFNMIGTDKPQNQFVIKMLQALEKGKNFPMTKGEQKRDFVSVDDVAQALYLATQNKKAANQIFNICSGKSIELRTLAEECKALLVSSSYIDYGALPYQNNEIQDMSGNSMKIKSLLNFSTSNSILEKIVIRRVHEKAC